MTNMGRLVCGAPQADGIAKTALDQLAKSVDEFMVDLTGFFNGEYPAATIVRFSPFCARALLENSCAALVGRLDAFRMLYLSEFQAQPEYDSGKRAKSSFSWSGDVITEDKVNNLWSIDHETPKISRALLSKHAEHVFWKPATEKMLDYAGGQPADEIINELLEIEAENYINAIRGRSLRLYSTLSKGVHWEFFTSALIFDEETVKNLIRDTCILVAQLALISHFIPTAYSCLTPEEALNNYRSIRRAIP